MPCLGEQSGLLELNGALRAPFTIGLYASDIRGRSVSIGPLSILVAGRQGAVEGDWQSTRVVDPLAMLLAGVTVECGHL